MSFTKLFIKLLSITTLIPILLGGCNSKPDPLSKLTPYERAVYSLYSQPVENISPQALLPIFKLGGDHTDLKRQTVLQEIKGKVIVWKLVAYEIKRIDADTVSIQTSSGRDLSGSDPFSQFAQGFAEGIGGVNQNVGTFIQLKVHPDQWGMVSNIKTGNLVIIRGRLKGESTMRNIEISSAVFSDGLADQTYKNVKAKLVSVDTGLNGKVTKTDDRDLITLRPTASNQLFTLVVHADNRRGVEVVPKDYNVEEKGLTSIRSGEHELRIDGRFPLQTLELWTESVKKKDVYTNSSIDFLAIYSKEDTPEFAIISSSNAGTCCPWVEYYLVLITSKGFEMFTLPESDSLRRLVVTRLSNNNLVFDVTHVTGKDPSGQPILGSFVVKAGDKRGKTID